MHNPPSVFVADDHAAIREGLKAYLEHHDVPVAGEAQRVEETLVHLDEDPADVYVLDLNMHGARGTAIIERCIAKKPDARIVIYSMRESLPTISAAYKAGAMAYITKSAGLEELMAAIRAVARGDTYFMAEVAARIAQYYVAGDEDRAPARALTDHELGIFVRLAQGESTDAIATDLDISTRTLANHISTIRNKLKVDRADFTKLALQYGLIDLPGDV